MAYNIAIIHPGDEQTKKNREQKQEQDIYSYLQDLGYNTTIVSNEAVNEFGNAYNFDLLIVDFRFANSFQEFAAGVKDFPLTGSLPSILLTASAEENHIKLLLSLNPHLILHAPINKTELTVNIDILINNNQEKKREPKFEFKHNDAVYIPKDLTHHKILKGSIMYIEADGSYCSINTTEGASYRMSLNLKQFMKQLNDPYFIRISRKHVINAHHVSMIRGDQLYVKSKALKLAKSRKKQVMSHFKFLRSG